MDVDVEGEGASSGLKGLLEEDDQALSLSAFEPLEKEFQDVTLACEDQQGRAHKVVGAAGSSKLRSILLTNPHPHPHGGNRGNRGNRIKIDYLLFFCLMEIWTSK